MRARARSTAWFEAGLYRPWGIGAWTTGGCLGGTVGEAESKFFREVHVLLIGMHLVVRFDWKRLLP